MKTPKHDVFMPHGFVAVLSSGDGLRDHLHAAALSGVGLVVVVEKG